MSVRTSFKPTFQQTGAKTAIVKFEEKPLDDQRTKLSFVVKTDPTITAVKAFIGFLFGFPPFDVPPEPRFPPPQGPSHSSHGIVFQFSTTEREHETALVMHTLLTLFYFDGPFVLHFTERAQPPAQPLPSPSRPTIEQSAPRKTAHTASSDPSWRHLSSRAGQEASGVSLSPRQSIDDELKTLRKERFASIKTVEASMPEHLAEKASSRAKRTGIDEPERLVPQSVDRPDETPFDASETHRRNAPNDTAAAPVSYNLQAYQAAFAAPPVDTHIQGYQEEVARWKANVAATTDGTPSAIEDAWHRQYLEELQNPKVAVSTSTEQVPETSNAEWQRQDLNIESAPEAPEATNVA